MCINGNTHDLSIFYTQLRGLTLAINVLPRLLAHTLAMATHYAFILRSKHATVVIKTFQCVLGRIVHSQTNMN